MLIGLLFIMVNGKALQVYIGLKTAMIRSEESIMFTPTKLHYK